MIYLRTTNARGKTSKNINKIEGREEDLRRKTLNFLDSIIIFRHMSYVPEK